MSFLAFLLVVTNDIPASWLAVATVGGAVGVTLYQHKKGDSPVNALGKVLIGFGIGFYLGGSIAQTLKVTQQAGSFIGGLCSPIIFAAINRKVNKIVDALETETGDK